MEIPNSIPAAPDSAIGGEPAQGETQDEPAVRRLQWVFGRPAVSVLKQGLTPEETVDIEEEFRRMALEEEAYFRRF